VDAVAGRVTPALSLRSTEVLAAGGCGDDSSFASPLRDEAALGVEDIRLRAMATPPIPIERLGEDTSGGDDGGVVMGRDELCEDGGFLVVSMAAARRSSPPAAAMGLGLRRNCNALEVGCCCGCDA
jgi:hypothetical protein